MPVIVALALRYVTRKIASQDVFIQNAIYMCFRMYPPSPTVELPTLFIFTSRFRGFFLRFRKIIPPFRGKSLWFRLFGTSNFRFALNFRLRSFNFWMMHNYRLPRLLRCCIPNKRLRAGRWLLERLYYVRRSFRLFRFVAARARPCHWRRVLVRRDRSECDWLLVALRPDRLRSVVFIS